MDTTRAIEINREDLLQVLAGLWAMVGLVAVGPMAACLPRAVRSHALRVLRSADAAGRRLIVFAARFVEPGPVAPRRERRGSASSPDRPERRRTGYFPLFDPRKNFDQKPRRAGAEPRVFFFDDSDPAIIVPPEISPDDPMDAQRLFDRLRALRRVLETLPDHAARFARLKARRHAACEPIRRTDPLRPGLPPGHRKRHWHKVDAILAECHALARMPPEALDSS